jgi:hypothetical protein
MNSDASSPNPDGLNGKPILHRRLERNTEHAFLKLIIAQDPSHESRQLEHRLLQTERDGRCVHRALLLVMVLFLVSLSGLGLCGILLPELLLQPNCHLLPGLVGLILGTLVSLVAFLGYLLWHRATVGHLHGECRFRILTVAKLHSSGLAAPIVALDFSRPVLAESPAASTMPLARLRTSALAHFSQARPRTNQ